MAAPSKSTILLAAGAVAACLVCLVPAAALTGVVALVLGAGAGAAVLGSSGIAVACLVLAAAVGGFGLLRRRASRRGPAETRP